MTSRRLSDTGEWTTRRYLSLLSSILIWGIVAIDAWYLWPTQLHGSTSMVIVSGVSMEPTYFTGDLVIARTMEPSVGDVIVYAPAGLGGSQIVHRIIGGNATDGWQMQGDNNDFIDPFTPKGDEVKGVVLVHYANFGRVTVLLLNPIVWAFILLISIVLLVWWSGDTCDDDPQRGSESSDGDDAGGDASEASADSGGDAADEPSRATAPEPVTAQLLTPQPVAAPHAVAAPQRAGEPRTRMTARALAAGLAGLLALGVAASPAAASQLTVNTTGGAAVLSYAHCDNLNLTASPVGAHNGNSYTQVQLGGLTPACAGLPLTVYLHRSNGNVIATASATAATPSQVITVPSYNVTRVTDVIVTINGWIFVAAWSTTPPPPPFPAAGQCDGVVTATGLVAPGTTCTLSWTSDLYYYVNNTIVYVLVVDANTAFTPASGPSGTYQDLTKWRFTLDLTTLANVGSLQDLTTGFNVYRFWQAGTQNVVVAPGETCADPTAVTFQENVAGNDPGATLVVSAAPIPGWDAYRLCQGP